MQIQTTAASGARRTGRRATSRGWLVLSLAFLALAGSVVALPAPARADDEAEKQLDFGTDMARRGLWKEALFRFLQADRHDPDNPRILNNIAVAYEALGLFDEALEYYQKALRLGPDEDDLRKNYSRFAEFYQSFRPKEEGPEASGEVAEDEGSAEADATAEAEVADDEGERPTPETGELDSEEGGA